MSGMGTNFQNEDQMEAVLSERSTSEINISYSDERGVEHIIVATGVTEGGRTKYVIENLESGPSFRAILDAARDNNAYIEIKNLVIPNTDEDTDKTVRLQIGSNDILFIEDNQDITLTIQVGMVDGVKQYLINGEHKNGGKSQDIIIDKTRDIILLAHHMGIGEIVFQNFSSNRISIDAMGRAGMVNAFSINKIYEAIEELPLESPLKSLKFEKSICLRREFLGFMRMLKNNTVIKYLAFDHNDLLIDQEDFNSLLEALKTNRMIEGFSFASDYYRINNNNLLSLLNELGTRDILRSVGISGDRKPVTDEVVDSLIKVISQNPIEKFKVHDIDLNSTQLNKLREAVNAKTILLDRPLDCVISRTEKQKVVFSKLVGKENNRPDTKQSNTDVSAFTEFGGKMLPSSQGRAR